MDWSTDIFMMKSKFLFLFLILLLISCKSFLEKQAEETNLSYDIRVKLKRSGDIEILKTDDITVENCITGERMKNGSTKKIQFVFHDNDCFINGTNFQSPMVIYSKNQKLIKINERYYFGKIKIIPGENGLDLINIVPIETYLISVVMSEMPLDFHYEALKAQAVIARTYSYYCMKKYGNNRDYDVDDTVSYQVYNGYYRKLNREKLIKLLKAVNDSRGMIVEYEGNPIVAYFHSNSGGKLVSGKEYFGNASDFPYLICKEDPYSTGKPNSKWNFSIGIEDFKNKINFTEDLSSDSITMNNEGFVSGIKTGDNKLTSRDLRKIIGYSNLKSERFTMNYDVVDDKVIFDGIGYGHGVGLSQWGAESMAEEGFKFNDIIFFYYPGTSIGYF
jgi:stage II sporulation protein D